MVEGDPADAPAQLRAAVYRDRPGIFDGLRNTLSELQSIARTYAPLQKYEVTVSALNAIANLLVGYLRLRDGDLVMPSSIHAMVGPTDFEFDTVLTEALEGITALQKAAIRSGDVQLSLQVINALEHLALQSINVKSLFARPDENPTTAFIRGYIFSPVQDGAVRGLDDVTTAGARALTNIAKALLGKHAYLTTYATIDDLEKLAYFGIMQRKAYVTGIPVKGITEILQVAVVAPIAQGRAIHFALDALQRVCVAELQFKSPPLDQNLRFAIGAFLDITQPTALANVEAQAIQGLSSAMKEGNDPKVHEYREAIRQLNEDLWSRLVAIGTAAAKTASSALFDINSNIAEIVKSSLWLYRLLHRTTSKGLEQDSAQERWLDDEFVANILKELDWIVGATYWRIFDALEPPININVVWEFFPTLSHIGIQALEANVPSLAESAVNELKSIALKAIEKPVQTMRSAARIAVFIARIGIVAQKVEEQHVVNVSVAALKDFQSRYLAKQREMQPDAESYDATLLNELADLKADIGKQRWLVDEEDASFFGRVRPQDVDTFAESLRH